MNVLESYPTLLCFDRGRAPMSRIRLRRSPGDNRRPGRRVARFRGAGGGCVPVASPSPRGFAYVSDFSAMGGATLLFAQKDAVDRAACARRTDIVRYFVDSGHPNGFTGYGQGLQDLARIVRDGDVVFVQHVNRFAADYAMALKAAVALASRGIKVVEAMGGDVTVGDDVAAVFATAALHDRA